MRVAGSAAWAFLLLNLLGCGREAGIALERPSAALAGGSAALGAGAATHADAASSSRSLRLGALIDANTGRSITSTTTTAGETLTATVYVDALDDIGRVVIPSGSKIELMVTALTPAGDRKGNDATMRLVVTGVVIRDHHYDISAELKSMYHSLAGRGFLPGEKNPAQSNGYGVVAGKVIGTDELGTIVGGAMRPAGSVVTASQPAGRDVVVLAGTPIVIKLTERFTLQWR